MSAWQSGEVITSSKINQKSVYIDSTAPATTYAGQLWYDTSVNLLKARDNTNSSWNIVSMTPDQKALFADGSTNSTIGMRSAIASEYIAASSSGASSNFINPTSAFTTFLQPNAYASITYPVVVYAQSRWWLVSGGNLYTSTDTVTWTVAQSNVMGTSYTGGCMCILINSNNAHIIQDTASTSYGLMYRCGALNSNGTVTWAQNPQTVLSAGTKYTLYGATVLPNGKVMFIYYNQTDMIILKNDNTTGLWTTNSNYPKTLNSLYTYYYVGVDDYYFTLLARSDNSVVIVDASTNYNALNYTLISSTDTFGTRTLINDDIHNNTTKSYCAFCYDDNSIEIVYAYDLSNSFKVRSITLNADNTLSTDVDLYTGKSLPTGLDLLTGSNISGTKDLIIYAMNYTGQYELWVLTKTSEVWDSKWYNMYTDMNYPIVPINIPSSTTPFGFNTSTRFSFITKTYYNNTNLKDNSLTTSWRPYPANNVTNTYCEVDFSAAIISGCKIYWGTDTNYLPSSFKFQALENGSWVDKLTVSSQPTANGWTEYSWTNPSLTTGIRIVLLTSGLTGSEIFEVLCYSPSSWAKHYHNWTIP